MAAVARDQPLFVVTGRNTDTANRPFYSGKHRRHAMNLQVIASPDGDIAWVSGHCPALCMT